MIMMTIQLSTTICEQNIMHYTNVLILNAKNNDDNVQNNVLIANHHASIMLCANNDSNDNATTTTHATVPQSNLNSIVVKFTKDIISSLLSLSTSKVDVAIMDGNSRQLLLTTTCPQMKQNDDCQLQHALLMF